MTPESPEIRQFQERLGINFKDQALLNQALSHRSVGSVNNERLEFLGDAILGMEIAKQLFTLHPKMDEGDLTRYRSLLVRKETLAELARQYQFQQVLKFGASDRLSGTANHDSVLADAFEAIIGAIFVDLGAKTTSLFIQKIYWHKLTNLPSNKFLKDAKSRLQEKLQSMKLALPKYIVLKEKTDHPQEFTVAVEIVDLKLSAQATAGSVRKAEMLAAEKILKNF